MYVRVCVCVCVGVKFPHACIGPRKWLKADSDAMVQTFQCHRLTLREETMHWKRRHNIQQNAERQDVAITEMGGSVLLILALMTFHSAY